VEDPVAEGLEAEELVRVVPALEAAGDSARVVAAREVAGDLVPVVEDQEVVDQEVEDQVVEGLEVVDLVPGPARAAEEVSAGLAGMKDASQENGLRLRHC
jgi:RNA 3'-terminal phosphate cyclase